MISEDVFGLVGVLRSRSNKAKQTCLSEVLLEGVRLDLDQLMIKQWQLLRNVAAIPVAEDFYKRAPQGGKYL